MMFFRRSTDEVPALKIGFTGTSRGLSRNQKNKLAGLLQLAAAGYDVIEAHHGDCVGADADFHDLVRTFLPSAKIIGHPGCDKDGNRPYAANKVCDEYRPVKYYIDRNHDIVDDVQTMLVAPFELTERKVGSGTWATWRYAQKVRRKRPLGIQEIWNN